MILYGSSISPFVRKVIAFAGEQRTILEVKPIGLGSDDPVFRAASPFAKIPALVDGDFGLSDSSAIVHYLDALTPGSGLIPIEARARGRTIWFDEWADTLLFGCGAKMFFNRIVAPMFLGRDGDLSVADRAEQEELPPLMDYLEGQIPASGFLVDDRITLADLAVASPLVNFDHLGLDLASWPKVRAYAAAIHARPSLAATIATEKAMFARRRATA